MRLLVGHDLKRAGQELCLKGGGRMALIPSQFFICIVDDYLQCCCA